MNFKEYMDFCQENEVNPLELYFSNPDPELYEYVVIACALAVLAEALSEVFSK